MSAPLHWRDYFPRGVQDPLGPNGEPVPTPTDHRLLWHIEGALAVSANTPFIRDLQAALRSYLNENCQHWWHAHEADDCIPAHRQCMWCCDVESLAEDGAR